MTEDPRNKAKLARLPAGLVDRLTKPFAYFLHIQAAAGAVLLLFTLAALMLSNSPWSHSFLSAWETPLGIRIGAFEFDRSMREWINDALMTLFFFLVALELKRELVHGELKNPRMAALSIAGALGGMLVPAALYVVLQSGRPGASGWGTVMATDTAFVIGCLALIGSRIPQSLRVFMLSLAIVDDIGAILVVAIGYSSHISWVALTLAVFVGFAFGKPVGVLAFSWLAVRLGIAIRPADLNWRMLAGGGLLAGIGFTMALFIAHLAFDESLIDSAKLGIFLASVVSAAAGLVLLMSLPARGKIPEADYR